MVTHRMTTLDSRTATARSARGASCVVMRDAGYRTRVSAMRFQAGCATERLSAVRERARGTRVDGVHVRGGPDLQPIPGPAEGPLGG